MRCIPLRLPPGADLRRTLESRAAEGEAWHAFVVAGIGSLSDATLRLAGAEEETVLQGAFEIISLSGTLTPDGVHLHMAIADAQGRVLGGHLCHGNTVRTTAEVLLVAMSAWRLSREHDPATGYRELLVRPAPDGSANTDGRKVHGMYIPPGFTTVTPYFFVAGAEAFVDFLVAGLGGAETLRTLRPDGRIGNAQVQLGSSTVMVSEASERYPPMAAAFYLYVEDADAAMQRALAHGATLEMAVGDMPYGDRQGGVRDRHGNIWWISQRTVHEPYSP